MGKEFGVNRGDNGMFAPGMMDPNWWKYNELNHRWYRDDDAYADYYEGGLMPGGFNPSYIGVHFDGAEGRYIVLLQTTQGAVSFEPAEDPIELKISNAMELKCPDGTVKYNVNKIVCEKKTLEVTMLKLSTNEEITVTMEIAPDGFTTELFKDLTSQPNNGERTEVTAPVSFGIPVAGTAQPSSEWICPCGAANSGNFCSQCGHQRAQ